MDKINDEFECYDCKNHITNDDTGNECQGNTNNEICHEFCYYQYGVKEKKEIGMEIMQEYVDRYK